MPVSESPVLLVPPQAGIYAAIKWTPLARDVIGKARALSSPQEAQRVLKQLTSQLRFLKFQRTFARLWAPSAAESQRLERHLHTLQTRREEVTRYLTQAESASYDLDLCALCYDADGACIAYISPTTGSTPADSQAAWARPNVSPFQHSGDDRTGTEALPNAFNETLSIQLGQLAPIVESISLIVLSVNHCFDRFQGSLHWSLLSLNDTPLLPSHPFKRAEPYKLYFLAQAIRTAEGWAIVPMETYLPFASNHKRMNRDAIGKLLWDHLKRCMEPR